MRLAANDPHFHTSVIASGETPPPESPQQEPGTVGDEPSQEPPVKLPGDVKPAERAVSHA